MSEFVELESKIQNREQFNLLVSKTLTTPLILLLISNIECAHEVVNHRYLKFQRWHEAEICRSDIHYEVITISVSQLRQSLEIEHFIPKRNMKSFQNAKQLACKIWLNFE